ncbi:acyl-CoA-binding protein [Lutibacter citreus]|uniref:acyl-CoA-binding protein n=1 Tax=Lutibacter citreus TaxID=2138210 RepID=UPI000DBE2281|nr:acyl-CoA-binding protein [Lutibacter citreus]
MTKELYKELDKEFEEAYFKASNTNTKLPQDVMLQFYAYYKQATKGNNYEESSSGGVQLRNAFKLNAWIQLNHLTEDKAKLEYIKLVNKHL